MSDEQRLKIPGIVRIGQERLKNQEEKWNDGVIRPNKIVDKSKAIIYL